MKRRATKTNPWKPRLSAGGANRTNLNGAMSRIHPPDDECLLFPPPSRRPVASGSDLMPMQRVSSFQPFNSRLRPDYYQSPPRYAPLWQPPPPQNYIPPQYARREAQTADKRKPIQRKGMFQNAKYSEAPPPSIDEDQIRHTEEVITKMIERSRRNHDYHPPNFAMRDSIRRAVYNLGVPDNYRAAPRYEDYEEPSRRPQNPRGLREFSRHSRGDRGDRGDRREEYEEEEEDDFEDDDETCLFSPPKRKKSKEHRKKQRNLEEYEDEEDEEEAPRPSRKVEKQRRKRQQLEEKEGDTSDEESMLLERSRNSNSSRTSRTSKTKTTPRITEERPASRGSKSSRNSTPKPPTPMSGPYVKDPDDDDNWKNSLPFMCAPNGAGAAMLERIGSAITTLPLRDDTKNSYSEVAMMLLGKSLKKLQTPRSEQDDDEEGIQSQLMNMSTRWARNPQPALRRIPRLPEVEEIDEVVPETPRGNTQLMRDISRIQHPDNFSTLQIDQSVFAIPRLMEVDRGIAEDWERGRIKKKMPPPMFQSSPVNSNAVPRTEEYGIAQLSSIRKGPEEYGICISDDDEDPKQFDMDDYIARGASQLNFSCFTADQDISFFAQPPSNNDDLSSPRNSQEDEMNIESESPKSPIEEEPREFQIETSKTKSDNTTNEFNSRFMFSPSRKKRKVDPMRNIEESAQRIFNEVYDSAQAQRQKYLF